MSEERLNFGGILGFVGGLVVLIYGVVEVYIGQTVQSISSIGGLPVQDVSWVVNAGIAGVVLGILIMIFSILMTSYSDYHVVLGFFVILFSLASLVSVGGGNGVGFLLGVIGGACGIALGEEPYQPPSRASSASTTSSPPSGLESILLGVSKPSGTPSQDSRSPPVLYRGCMNCGKASPATLTSCPDCGAKF